MANTEQPRVVVGVDGSEPSLQALREAADQTRRLHGTLECVIAWEMPTATGIPIPLPTTFNPAAVAHAVVDAAVEKVLGTSPDIPVTTHVIEGHPARVVPEASKGAALLVIGSDGHHGPFHSRIGSVADASVRHAACPVLVIRPKSEAAVTPPDGP